MTRSTTYLGSSNEGQ